MRTGIVHHEQTVGCDTRCLEQCDGLCLGIKSIKFCRFARRPIAHGFVACQNDSRRQTLVACAIRRRKITPSDFEQTYR